MPDKMYEVIFQTNSQRMHKNVNIVSLMQLVPLFGCSDASDDWSTLEPDSPAAGIYVPSTFKPKGEAVLIGNTEAIVSPEGHAWLIMMDGPWLDEVIPQTIPFQVSGPLTISPESVTASMRVYPDGKLDAFPLSATGSFVPYDSISAEYTWGDESGDFFLRYSDLNEGTPGLEKLEGLWGVVMGFVTPGFPNIEVTLTIYSDGTAFGSDTTGCTYSGNFSIIGPQYNFYNLDLELSSCGQRDGLYSGLAFIRPCCRPDPAGQAIVIGTSSSDRSFNARLFGPNYSP